MGASFPGVVNNPGSNVPAAMDNLIAKGAAKPMIVVMPNAYSVYAGSMYSSSVTTGAWEAYIAEDLVSLYRQSLPDDSRSHEPRAGRPFDGRVWHDSDRHEAAGGVFKPLHHQRMLPDERSASSAVEC